LTEFKYVGKPFPRVDALEKVTGSTTFAFDLEVPGMLYVKLLRSPLPHAKILEIDDSKARKVPGVVAIATGRDFPIKLGIYVGDRDVLAREKVLWVGHPVAAVVAESLEIAEEAVDLIEVKYEPLEPVFDPIEALKPGAPIIHERLSEYRRLPTFRPKPGTNIANVFTLRKGDVKRGFEKSDLIVENEFSMPQVSHVYMETMSVIAHYKQSGDVEVWSSTQSPFTVRYLTSICLGIPIRRILVHAPCLGGGFGGKAGLNMEPLAILLSKKAGYRPVKLVLSREENFTSAAVRVGLKAWIKTGVKEDGRLVAEQIKYVFDAGAYADYAVNVGRAAGYAGTGPYDVPNVFIESLTVYTNKPYATAFRGFGHMEFHWCIERQMDIIARKLGMDPLEFRLKNLLKPGTSFTATGVRLREDAGRPDQCVKAVAQALDWGEVPSKPKEPWKFRGKGIACLMKGPAQPPNSASSAIIRFNEDGSVELQVGTSEMGQGTITGLAQIAAEELGIPVEKVKVRPMKSTDSDPYTWQTVGSRSLFMDGRAVIEAARDAKRQVLELASQVLRVPAENLELAEDRVFVKGEPWKEISLSQLVMGYMHPNGESVGGPIVGRGRYIATGMTNLDPESGQGNPTIFETFGAQGVEVEVDVLTGEVKVLRIIAAFDIGRIINPMLLKGQIYGGSVMAMSIALYEQMTFNEEGRLLNPNLTDYKVARANDAPSKIVPILIENPQKDGPYGARGIGELTMLAVPAAIGNAIYNAIGVEIKDLPMTPENVWRQIMKQRPELIEIAVKQLGGVKQ